MLLIPLFFIISIFLLFVNDFLTKEAFFQERMGKNVSVFWQFNFLLWRLSRKLLENTMIRLKQI